MLVERAFGLSRIGPNGLSRKKLAVSIESSTAAYFVASNDISACTIGIVVEYCRISSNPNAETRFSVMRSDHDEHDVTFAHGHDSPVQKILDTGSRDQYFRVVTLLDHVGQLSYMSDMKIL